MPRHLLIALAASFSAITACSNDSKSAEAASELRSDSAGGLVVAPSEPYRPTAVGTSADLVVTLAGDSMPAAATAPACGTGLAIPTETVFWVDGIREGKALPNERRYQLVNGNCGLQPRLQATVIGGAVNVMSEAGVHRLVFVRAGTTDTLQTMPFSLDGSIVATDRLTKTAGIVEVSCTKHPNEKAYIAVFDHPYFGVASSGDKVTLGSVPPGDYQVMTWHEGMATPTTVPMKVGGTSQTEIVLR